MNFYKRAFTLIELLVVIAIIAILAAILFPVFAQAKIAAKRTAWLSSEKQVDLGIIMYTNDSDDMMVPADSGGIGLPGWGYGFPDHVWPELVQPYIKNWLLFRCQGDPNATDAGLSQDPFGNPVSQSDPQIHYYWGERADFGLNYEFLTPWIYRWNTDNYVGSQAINMSQINQTSKTMLGVESMWARDANSGAPQGGGNWTVEPPCIYDSNGTLLVPVDPTIWQPAYDGWVPNPTGVAPFNWLEWGGAYPYFLKKFTVARTDGHVHVESVAGLSAGCDVQPFLGGAAFDGNKYMYDLR